MGEDFLTGNLYLSDGEHVHTWNDLSFACEMNTNSINEYAEALIRIAELNRGSMSCEVNAEDLSTLNASVQSLAPPETFWFEYDTPIMIQARWHKKKRVNKKWLHRFGMKPDTVRVRKEGRALTYDIDSGEVEFETTSKSEYIWRQDQLKKYLKMEWL